MSEVRAESPSCDGEIENISEKDPERVPLDEENDAENPGNYYISFNNVNNNTVAVVNSIKREGSDLTDDNSPNEANEKTKNENEEEAIDNDTSQIATNNTDAKMTCPKCPFVATDLLAFIEHLNSVHVKSSDSASSQAKKSLKQPHGNSEADKSDQPVIRKKLKRASRQTTPSNTVVYPFVPGQTLPLPPGLEQVQPNKTLSTSQINPIPARRHSVAQAQARNPIPQTNASSSPLHFTKRSSVSHVPQAGIKTPHTIGVQGVHCPSCSFRTSKKQYLTRHINSAHGGDTTEKTWEASHESSNIKRIVSRMPIRRNTALRKIAPQIAPSATITKTPEVKQIGPSTHTTWRNVVKQIGPSLFVTRNSDLRKIAPQIGPSTTNTKRNVVKKISPSTAIPRNSALRKIAPQIAPSNCPITRTNVVKQIVPSTTITRTNVVKQIGPSTTITRLPDCIKNIPPSITITTTPAIKQIAPSMTVTRLPNSKATPISGSNLNPTPALVNDRGSVNGVHFACLKCPFTTDNLDSLSSHEENHHGNKVDLKNASAHFQCKHCPFKTTRQTHMINHVRIVHKKSIVIPPPVRRDSDVSVTKLATLDAGTNRFRCLKCRDRFLSEANLKHHMSETHTPGSTYCCRYCTYRNESYFSLAKHSRASHPGKKVLFSFVRANYRGEAPRTLSRSNVMLSTVAKVSTPVRTISGSSTSQAMKDPDPKRTTMTSIQKTSSRPSSYHCNQCSFRASQVWQISQHARTFHSSKSGAPFVPIKLQYQCPLCGVKLIRGPMLEQHMNGHKVSRNEINKSGNNNDNNNSGRRSSSWTMTKELFSCPLCAFHTESSPAIARHMSVNHSTVTIGDRVLDLKVIQGCYIKLMKVPIESTEMLLQVQGTPEDIVVELDPIEINDESADLEVSNEVHIEAFQKTCTVQLERVDVSDPSDVVESKTNLKSMENRHCLSTGNPTETELEMTRFESQAKTFGSAEEYTDMPHKMLKRATRSLDTPSATLIHVNTNDSLHFKEEAQNEQDSALTLKRDKKPQETADDHDSPVDEEDDEFKLFLETTPNEDNTDISEATEHLDLKSEAKIGSQNQIQTAANDSFTQPKLTIKAESKVNGMEPNEIKEDVKVEQPRSRGLKRRMTFTEDMSFKTPKRASRIAKRTFSYLESPNKCTKKTACKPQRYLSDRFNNSNAKDSADLPKQYIIGNLNISKTADDPKKKDALLTISNIKTESPDRLTNIKTESIEQLFCDQCSFSSVVSKTLDQHKRLTHGNLSSVHCGQCSFTALNESVLSFHTKFVHGV